MARRKRLDIDGLQKLLDDAFHALEDGRTLFQLQGENKKLREALQLILDEQRGPCCMKGDPVPLIALQHIHTGGGVVGKGRIFSAPARRAEFLIQKKYASSYTGPAPAPPSNFGMSANPEDHEWHCPFLIAMRALGKCSV